MKTNLKTLIVFLSLSVSFIACQKELTPEEQRAINIAAADAAGAMEFMISSVEMPFYYACPECVLAGTAIAAAAASAAEATLFDPPIPIVVDLPIELKVASNPQENIGVMHNKVLDYMMKKIPKSEFPNLMNESYTKTLTTFAADFISKNNVEKEILIKNVTSYISQNNDNLNSNFQRYFKQDGIAAIQNLNKINTLTNNAKSFCLDFISNFNKRKTKNVLNNIIYINSEIVKVINNSDDEKLKTLKLSFLSVYKHSYYYWNNKS